MSKKDSIRYSLANVFDLPGFVETREVQRVADLCQALRQTPSLGMLLGMPGVGKTWAVQYVAQNEPEPADFRCSPVIYTSYDVKAEVHGLLINLLNCLGPDYRAPIGDMTRLVCCWIHRRMTELIIIDKADWLDKASWHVLSDIQERTRCAFLFIGQPDLPRKMEGRHYQPIRNRLSLGMEMRPFTYDELFQFVKIWQHWRIMNQESIVKRSFHLIGLDEEAEAVKEMYRVTMGNLRRSCYLLNR
jgi:DNA transposition AAA+ family ATPase